MGAAHKLSYWDWQRALEAVFFVSSTSPKPFVFFLNEEEADRLWPDVPSPARALAAAVNARLAWAAGRALFRPIQAESRRWQQRSTGSPPPTLPLLAVTVLAASAMHRDTEAGPSAYFYRLAQTLRPALAGSQVDAAAKQLSQGFGDVARMWRELHRWVELHRNTIGTSTIRDDPHFSRIGFALSQALIRRSDAMRLTAFWAALDVGSRGVPDDNALLGWLRLWLARPRGLSEQFCRALDDPRNEEMMAAHLRRLAEGWDGTVVTAEGRRRLEFRLVIDLEVPSARWVVPMVAGLDQAELRVGQGGVVRLTQPGFGPFFSVEGRLPSAAAGLASGLTAAGDDCVASFDDRPVLAFREDAAAGGWMSMPSPLPFEEHLFVVEPGLRSQLEDALEVAAEPGWQLKERLGRELLGARLLYRRVRFSDTAAFENAARALSGGLIQALRPELGSRPRLTAGLPVARAVGTNIYLAGGEPDLNLPTGLDARTVDASLDGHAQSPPFMATGFPIELRRLGPLPDGRHEVVVDGDTLSFVIADKTEPLAARTGPILAWRSANRYCCLAGGDLSNGDVTGAHVRVRDRLREPLLVRRGAQAWLIDRYGNCSRLADQAPSSSQAARGMPTPYYRAVDPGPDDAWLVQARGGRLLAPRLISWTEPHFANLDDESVRLWRELERAAAPDPLWRLYLKAWRAYPA
jgi:hypothetical protein